MGGVCVHVQNDGIYIHNKLLHRLSPDFLEVAAFKWEVVDKFNVFYLSSSQPNPTVQRVIEQLVVLKYLLGLKHNRSHLRKKS